MLNVRYLGIETEERGFEPLKPEGSTGFGDRRFKPLSHSSVSLVEPRGVEPLAGKVKSLPAAPSGPRENSPILGHIAMPVSKLPDLTPAL